MQEIVQVRQNWAPRATRTTKPISPSRQNLDMIGWSANTGQSRHLCFCCVEHYVPPPSHGIHSLRFSRYWRRTAGGCRALSHQYVNLRAGPGTDFPVILTVQAQAPISIRGCLGDYTWCDVVFGYDRGWMRSIYLSGIYQGYYYPLRDYAPRLGYSVANFDINQYWDLYYRDRTFYQDRSQCRSSTRRLGAGQCRSAMAPLHVRPLGLHRSLRMEVELRQAVWLGHLPLRPMGFLKPGWLVLGAGQPLGSGLGVMAVLWQLFGLGATPALLRWGCECQHPGRDGPWLLLASGSDRGIRVGRPLALHRAG